MAAHRTPDSWLAPRFAPRKPPERVYHYTTSGGLIGIIDSNNLRGTDVRYLNDPGEFQFGFKAVAHCLYEALFENGFLAGNGAEFETRKRKVLYGRSLGEIWKRAPDAVAAVMSKALLGVCCFCENDDLLSQWRGYGSNLGYAIGFESAKLLQLPNEMLPLGNVQYLQPTDAWNATGRDQQASDFIQGLKASWGAWVAKVDALEGSDDQTAIDEVRQTMNQLMLGVAVQIKHASFYEEREWRTADMEFIKPADEPLGKRPKAPQFRDGPLGVTPYLEFHPRDNDGRLPIRDVVVGPGPAKKRRMAAVRGLLIRYGYDITTIDIRPSRIPFRHL